MGASWFQVNARGASINEAYYSAQEDAVNECGHQDGYNGTISTTYKYNDLTEQFKRSGKSMAEYIDMQMDKLQKRDCAAICLEKPVANTNKTKSQVTNLVTKGTKKWVLKYTVGLQRDDMPLGSYDTKGEAVEKARKYTEQTGETTEVYMEKTLEKITPIVARITYKKSSTEKLGRWVFFGWAAE
jgi:hypothetical protein